MITRSVLDTEYVSFPVELVVNGNVINPTGDVVQFAFMPSPADANPASGDWHTGSWYTPTPGKYGAQILVGPLNGGIVLASGLYNVWIKITDNPEVPVRVLDLLNIT